MNVCYCTGACKNSGEYPGASNHIVKASYVPGYTPPTVTPPWTQTPPKIKSIEYNPDGTIKKVEYFE